MRLRVRSLALLSGLRIPRCRELWCKPATTALIRPLAWEPPYAVGAALEKTKRPKKKKKFTDRIRETECKVISLASELASSVLSLGGLSQPWCLSPDQHLLKTQHSTPILKKPTLT